MTDWTIDALQVGVLQEVTSESLIHGDRTRRVLDIPLIMFVLRSPDRVVVVDTGGPTDADVVRRHLGFPYTCDDHMHPVAAIRRLGIDPGEVDTVINTHLHWDHSWNNDSFPEATVVVQRSELEHAVHPDPTHLGSYGIRPGLTPAWASDLHRMRAVRGRSQVAPGLEVVPLPGHTPGSQGVVVTTKVGTYVITGDCVSTFEAWGEPHEPARPSGSLTHLPEYFETLTWLKETGWLVLPSHDPAVLAQATFGA